MNSTVVKRMTNKRHSVQINYIIEKNAPDEKSARYAALDGILAYLGFPHEDENISDSKNSLMTSMLSNSDKAGGNKWITNSL